MKMHRDGDRIITHTEYMRKWRAKNPLQRALMLKKYRAGNTKLHRKTEANYKKNHPDRFRAGHKLRNAVLEGRVIKPDHCSHCGLVCNPEGHHQDYSKPLEVIWLCRPCHRKEDGRTMHLLGCEKGGRELAR